MSEYGSRYHYQVIVASPSFNALAAVRAALAAALTEAFEGFTLTRGEGHWRGEIEPAYIYDICTQGTMMAEVEDIFKRFLVQCGDVDCVHVERWDTTAFHFDVPRHPFVTDHDRARLRGTC